MTYETASEIYQMLLWLIYATVPVALYAAWRRDWALLRCAAVFLINETLLYYVGAGSLENHWAFVMAVNIASMVAVMWNPAGYGQLVIGTTFLVAAFIKLMFGLTDGGYGAYLLSWSNGAMITALQALVLFTWAGGSNGRGRRILDAISRRLVVSKIQGHHA